MMTASIASLKQVTTALRPAGDPIPGGAGPGLPHETETDGDAVPDAVARRRSRRDVRTTRTCTRALKRRWRQRSVLAPCLVTSIRASNDARHPCLPGRGPWMVPLNASTESIARASFEQSVDHGNADIVFARYPVVRSSLRAQLLGNPRLEPYYPPRRRHGTARRGSRFSYSGLPARTDCSEHHTRIARSWNKGKILCETK